MRLQQARRSALHCIKTKTPSGLPMSIDFEHQTKRNLEFLVAAHKDLVERIDRRRRRPRRRRPRRLPPPKQLRRPSSPWRPSRFSTSWMRSSRGSRQSRASRARAAWFRESDVVRPSWHISWHAFFVVVCSPNTPTGTAHTAGESLLSLMPAWIRCMRAGTDTFFFRFGIAIFFTVHAEHTAPRLTPLTAHTRASRQSTRSIFPATASCRPSSGGRSRARRSRGSRAST